MRISARSDYAIRALLELALANEGASRALLTCDAIADRQDIPTKFLSAILTDLRRAGLIASQRGADGGFRIARPLAAITVADVIRIVDGPLASVHGTRPQDVSYNTTADVLRPLWIAVRVSLREVLEHVTLADLAEGRLPQHIQALTEDPDAWRDH